MNTCMSTYMCFKRNQIDAWRILISVYPLGTDRRHGRCLGETKYTKCVSGLPGSKCSLKHSSFDAILMWNDIDLSVMTEMKLRKHNSSTTKFVLIGFLWFKILYWPVYRDCIWCFDYCFDLCVYNIDCYYKMTVTMVTQNVMCIHHQEQLTCLARKYVFKNAGKKTQSQNVCVHFLRALYFNIKLSV